MEVIVPYVESADEVPHMDLFPIVYQQVINNVLLDILISIISWLYCLLLQCMSKKNFI